MNSTNDPDLSSSNEYSFKTQISPAPASARVITQPMVMREIRDAGASNDSPIDVSRYIHSLRRNWLLGMTLGIIAAGPLAVVAWSLNPVKYTAVELVQISSSQQSLVFDSGDRVAAGDLKGFKSTQRQLMIQPFALNKALKDSKAAEIPFIAKKPDPIGWLQKDLEVTFPDQAEIMQVALKCTDADVAYRVVKGVVDTYMNEVVDKEKAERRAQIDTLERILKETEERVRKKRNELSNLVLALGMSDKTTVDLSQQLTLQEAGQVRAQLAKTKFDIMDLESELAFRKLLTSGNAEVAGNDNKSPSVSTAVHNEEASGVAAKDSRLQSTSHTEPKDPTARRNARN